MKSTDPMLTRLEHQALMRAISKVENSEWREALFQQISEAHVTSRTDKDFGYYVDFQVPSALRIVDLPEDFNHCPPEAEANHPDGKNGIFFIVYTKDGVISFMEIASTTDWPEDEDQIAFCD